MQRSSLSRPARGLLAVTSVNPIYRDNVIKSSTLAHESSQISQVSTTSQMFSVGNRYHEYKMWLLVEYFTIAVTFIFPGAILTSSS